MIKIICVGKIKEKFFIDAINEYQKRLSKYTKLEIIECKDYDIGSIDNIKKLESEEILKKINDKDFVITLEIDGKSLDSIEFKDLIDKTLTTNSNLTFIIGGSYGLDDDVKSRSNYKLSFSKLTFPHQLFRIILLEQIYRAYKIINNESYHK
ncbi:MAG: 23S rRNA (pseudouridine(1915)-N(3))-methyltransferase RlmH [Bacilli bacterium]|nr:23S rRNA (pseudouridine(1915)-N(3))-methyltransferase RlmH [Bacilli bacterium]